MKILCDCIPLIDVLIFKYLLIYSPEKCFAYQSVNVQDQCLFSICNVFVKTYTSMLCLFSNKLYPE